MTFFYNERLSSEMIRQKKSSTVKVTDIRNYLYNTYVNLKEIIVVEKSKRAMRQLACIVPGFGSRRNN